MRTSKNNNESSNEWLHFKHFFNGRFVVFVRCVFNLSFCVHTESVFGDNRAVHIDFVQAVNHFADQLQSNWNICQSILLLVFFFPWCLENIVKYTVGWFNLIYTICTHRALSACWSNMINLEFKSVTKIYELITFENDDDNSTYLKVAKDFFQKNHWVQNGKKEINFVVKCLQMISFTTNKYWKFRNNFLFLQKSKKQIQMYVNLLIFIFKIPREITVMNSSQILIQTCFVEHCWFSLVCLHVFT